MWRAEIRWIEFLKHIPEKLIAKSSYNKLEDAEKKKALDKVKEDVTEKKLKQYGYKKATLAPRVAKFALRLAYQNRRKLGL